MFCTIIDGVMLKAKFGISTERNGVKMGASQRYLQGGPYEN
jgi:hypothetical protein